MWPRWLVIGIRNIKSRFGDHAIVIRSQVLRRRRIEKVERIIDRNRAGCGNVDLTYCLDCIATRVDFRDCILTVVGWVNKEIARDSVKRQLDLGSLSTRSVRSFKAKEPLTWSALPRR